MTTIDQELLDIALEGLANQKKKVDLLEVDLSEVKKREEFKVSKLKPTIAKLESMVSTAHDTIPSVVNAAIAKIPIPTNGKDGADGKSIKGDTGAPGKDGRPGVDGKSIQGKQGVPGKSIKGDPGKDGKSIKGDKGKPGVDGVGIKSISSKDNKLKVTMTDGNVKEVALPSINSPAVFGGVPSNPEISTLRNLADTDTNNSIEGDVLSFVGGKWTNTSNTGGTSVTLKIRAKEPIAKGVAVSYVGWNAGLDSIEVIPTDNTVGVSIGVTTTSLATNQIGFIVTNGTLEGVDTSAYSEGSILYVDNSGGFTEVEPTSGFRQPLAFVLRSQRNNGALLVTTDYPKQTAIDVPYDNTDSGLLATKVKDAIDEVAAASGGIDTTLKRRTEIEAMFKVAQSTSYKELVYDQGNITDVDIYTNSSKITKLFSKVIGYNNGNISTVSITDNVNGGTLNKVMTYLDGNISSVTSTYTQ